MVEIIKDVCTPTNIEKLRVLVDSLEKQDLVSDDNHEVLKQIENVIIEEKEYISKLKNPENKLRHYESICKSILTLLSTVKV